MKCKKCGEEINLTIFGMPEDICFGCFSKDEEEKDKVLEKNVNMERKNHEN